MFNDKQDGKYSIREYVEKFSYHNRIYSYGFIYKSCYTVFSNIEFFASKLYNKKIIKIVWVYNNLSKKYSITDNQGLKTGLKLKLF